jgi:streptogramin lyase
VGRITTNGAITEFAISPGNLPQGITGGPDGNVWFTEFYGNKIVRITPSGTMAEFNIPTVDSRPIAITNGPDGNLWFVELAGNKIGRITPTGAISEFENPIPLSGLFGITTGADGNLWFVEWPNFVGRITPTGIITTFLAPGRGPIAIASGPDRKIWVALNVANGLGRLDPDAPPIPFSIPTLGSGLALALAVALAAIGALILRNT